VCIAGCHLVLYKLPLTISSQWPRAKHRFSAFTVSLLHFS